MIPQTILSLVGFLLLAAPGLVFEGIRGHYRQPLEQTPFRETGRVALASLLFSGVSVGLLAVVRSAWPETMPDIGRWLEKGKSPRSVSYVSAHYRLIARAGIVEILAACLLATFAAFLLYQHRRSIVVPDPLLWQMIHKAREGPDQLAAAALLLVNGTIYTGLIAGVEYRDTLKESAVALGPPMTIFKSDGSPAPVEPPWSRVLVPLDQVQSVWLQFKQPAAPGAGATSL